MRNPGVVPVASPFLSTIDPHFTIKPDFQGHPPRGQPPPERDPFFGPSAAAAAAEAAAEAAAAAEKTIP